MRIKRLLTAGYGTAEDQTFVNCWVRTEDQAFVSRWVRTILYSTVQAEDQTFVNRWVRTEDQAFVNSWVRTEDQTFVNRWVRTIIYSTVQAEDQRDGGKVRAVRMYGWLFTSEARRGTAGGCRDTSWEGIPELGNTHTHRQYHHLPASLSGTFLQTLPELVTSLKGHALFISSQLSTDAATGLRR